MTRLSLFVRHVLIPGHEAAFDALVAEALPGIAEAEPGTLLYVVQTVDDQPLHRHFFEMYRDQAAFEAHEQRPHVRRFLEARPQHVQSVSVDFMTPIDGSVGPS
jgi:quinol monooxygenase YgiN